MRRRRRKPGNLLWVFLVGVMGLAACHSGDEEDLRPSVIMVVIDTLRRDHMSLYGYEKNTTPGLDRTRVSCALLRPPAHSYRRVRVRQARPPEGAETSGRVDAGSTRLDEEDTPFRSFTKCLPVSLERSGEGDQREQRPH